MQDIGFVHYWWRHDYPGGGQWFERASEVAGRPVVAAVAGGDDAGARAAIASRRGSMWEAIRQSAEIDWLRSDAERRLLQLDALDEIDALQQRVDRLAQPARQRRRRLGDASSRAGVLPRRPGRSRAARRTRSTPIGRVSLSQSLAALPACRPSRSGSAPPVS